MLKDGLSVLMEKMNDLDEVSMIKHLAQQEESRTLEFKEYCTVNYDIINNFDNTDKSQKGIIKKERDKVILEKIFKPISAYLNTEGGTLLVGVTDEGEIAGINDELTWLSLGENTDSLFNYVKDKFKSYLGEYYQQFCHFKTVRVTGKIVIHISCDKSDRPCFIKDDFYIRSFNSSDPMKGKDLYDYIMKRFHENIEKDEHIVQ